MTAAGVMMLVALLMMSWRLDRPGTSAMDHFIEAIVKPWIIASGIVPLVGCLLLSTTVSNREALIAGGVLSILSVLFWLTMPAFVSPHSWTAVFLVFGAVGGGAAVLFLLGAVGRYVAHRVRSIR